ncbi:hypothetical protein CONPUDRAFT_152652 [Coniophora puteana RWD-64-598 SS2]|uniref:C2H2-type domain-containing protein n=1 Tax=Coniophora puteana (strain RWD-64-598) TaxID=741705 RepID=A0A5M3MRG5_CONPW|nr:uncharacterized protein CONPUDRAFT_152652 [Coniophora puteana RWD-64-598 SS2]EIW81742.1 hypothetical protein CONPUDRAFT_152652 [Coniophora puteana RWD-64-598 SS2]
MNSKKGSTNNKPSGNTSSPPNPPGISYKCSKCTSTFPSLDEKDKHEGGFHNV